MSFFVRFSDLIFEYKIRIIILLILISITLILNTWPSVIEGFTENTVLSDIKNPFFACPVIKRNIQINEGLIEGFIQNNSVESLQHTTDIITAFKNTYNELACDSTVFKDIRPEDSIPTS
jgi:hypothetical protein